MQVQRTIKRREGVWGIVKGDKGGASQVAPLSPLKKKPRLESQENTKTRQNQKRYRIQKRCFASLNMTRFQLSLRGDSRSNQTSLNTQHGWLPRSHVVLARNDPPPTPSAREGAESHNNKNGRIGGATLVALTTWELHIKSAVKTAPPKIPFVMLSEAKHLFWIPCSLILSSFHLSL